MVDVRVFVRMIKPAIGFYSALGFEVVEQWGSAIAIVQLGDLRLWLSGPATSAAKPWVDGTTPVPGGFTRIVLPLEIWTSVAAAAIERGGRVVNGPLSGPGGTQLIVCRPRW